MKSWHYNVNGRSEIGSKDAQWITLSLTFLTTRSVLGWLYSTFRNWENILNRFCFWMSEVCLRLRSLLGKVNRDRLKVFFHRTASVFLRTLWTKRTRLLGLYFMRTSYETRLKSSTFLLTAQGITLVNAIMWMSPLMPICNNAVSKLIPWFISN